ncbi:MAG: DUF885 domain-containing protein [Candidatus Polarisedimenticolia bacterium]
MSDRPARGTPVGSVPGGIPAGAAGADLEFYRLADAWLLDQFRAFPTFASGAGDHRFDDRLEDPSLEGIGATLDAARAWRARLRRLDAGRLSPGAKVDFEIVGHEIDATLFAFEEARIQETDPRFYLDLAGTAILYLLPLEEGSPLWPARLEALLGRLRRLPGFLDGARRALKAPPRVTTELVTGLIPGTVDFLERTLPPLFGRAPSLAPRLHEALRGAADALRSFRDWLSSDLMPRSTGDWRLGRERWIRKLQLALHETPDPEEIAARAAEALADGRRRMLEVAEPLHDRLFPAHRHTETGEARLDAIVRETLEAASRCHPTRDTLFETASRAVDRARAFVRDRGLMALPPDDDPLVIEPTPGFMDGVAVAFFNPPPSLEPHLKKSFWISSVPRGRTPEEDRLVEESFLREYNDHALLGVAIHEAVPGHYVQYARALRSPAATVYRKVFGSGVFAEGWAVLAERLMFEAGLADGEPECLLVHLKHSLRPPINALLDVRLHTTPMSDEEGERFAIDLMTRGGFQEASEARAKLRRARVSSTQLSTYFVGSQALLDLLLDARGRGGTAFEERGWMDRLLSFGAVPPRHLKSLMDAHGGGAART